MYSVMKWFNPTRVGLFLATYGGGGGGRFDKSLIMMLFT